MSRTRVRERNRETNERGTKKNGYGGELLNNRAPLFFFDRREGMNGKIITESPTIPYNLDFSRFFLGDFGAKTI